MKITEQLFCRMPLNLGLSVLLRLDTYWLCTWVEISQKSCSLQSSGGTQFQFIPLLVIFTLITYLIQVMPARIPCYKVSMQLLIHSVVWSTSKLCKYLVPHLTSNVFLYSYLYECFFVDYILLLFISMFRLFLIWPMRAHSGWLLCPYGMCPSFFEHVFTFWHRFILYCTCLSPAVGCFSGEPWILLGENDLLKLQSQC